MKKEATKETVEIVEEVKTTTASKKSTTKKKKEAKGVEQPVEVVPEVSLTPRIVWEGKLEKGLLAHEIIHIFFAESGKDVKAKFNKKDALRYRKIYSISTKLNPLDRYGKPVEDIEKILNNPGWCRLTKGNQDLEKFIGEKDLFIPRSREINEKLMEEIFKLYVSHEVCGEEFVPRDFRNDLVKLLKENLLNIKVDAIGEVERENQILRIKKKREEEAAFEAQDKIFLAAERAAKKSKKIKEED